MSEILKQTQRYEKLCIGCAKGMANYAGFELTSEQLDNYAELRMVSEPEPLSDQKLLFLLLHPEQQITFKQRYPHIDFSYNQ